MNTNFGYIRVYFTLFWDIVCLQVFFENLVSAIVPLNRYKTALFSDRNRYWQFLGWDVSQRTFMLNLYFLWKKEKK